MANDLRRLWGREESGWAEYRSARGFETEPPFALPVNCAAQIRASGNMELR
jgi:hypothetical protein